MEPIIFANYLLMVQGFFEYFSSHGSFLSFGINHEIVDGVHCRDSLYLYITFYLIFIRISKNYSTKIIRRIFVKENSGKITSHISCLLPTVTADSYQFTATTEFPILKFRNNKPGIIFFNYFRVCMCFIIIFNMYRVLLFGSCMYR